jgi:hypothetical protein
MTPETTAAVLPDEKSHGTAGTTIVIEVATPMITACRRLRLGSERNWLAAIPRPSAMSRPITAARTTLLPWVIVASINAMLATSPSEAPKMVVVRVTESVSSRDFRFVTVKNHCPSNFLFL